MQSTIQLDEVDKIIDGIGCEEKNIISILQGVQEHYRYLPKEVFPHIAKRLGVGEARLFSVATFYENFSLEPKGKFVIKVCDGTACHVRQSPPILARLRQELGACGLAPVITVNAHVHAEMTPDKASAILKKLKEDGEC